jgi:hypothetical protein
MNLPEALRLILGSFPKKYLRGVRFAAFNTFYKMSALLNRFPAGKKLSRKLSKLGGVRLLPPEIFLVSGREGPLAPGELQWAEYWASQLPL